MMEKLTFLIIFNIATRDPSNLLAHEAAFALGQMQDAEAVPHLEDVLKDLSLHPIVRHEVFLVITFGGPLFLIFTSHMRIVTVI